VLHFLGQNNFGDRLKNLLEDKDTKVSYVDSPYSPIAKAKMQTFLPLINHLKELQLKDKVEIFTELDV
jgi:hypothetical protein